MIDYNKWTLKDLKKEANIIYAAITKKEKVVDEKRAKKLCINGITPADIAVEYTPKPNNRDGLYYSFYIKHDGKLFDIYYESGGYDGHHNFVRHPWWPHSGDNADDQWDSNRAFEFIPPGFGEACENLYSYQKPLHEAIKQLKKYGITDIKEGTE